LQRAVEAAAAKFARCRNPASSVREPRASLAGTKLGICDGGDRYTVKSGDTCGSISTAFRLGWDVSAHCESVLPLPKCTGPSSTFLAGECHSSGLIKRLC
jgi:hypothetical protein